ncbi:Wnt inhibitory factor 1 [Hondaea fermentalgiana]|uniref:Wnt inhibitory factor 1 n=1 Tax=Hondaea fermentalgiana TaxID=2315210 RepID=A0A2R5GM74_9STRA|nr:Wnt inhibitory factor 1 [Hondaea fermentalgiana]|eukprot:GBG29733.1 Wnt inhibitory factor 1 [Hondaea fermentalgiana]
MRLHRSWTEKHWCESVQEPHWPFAYAKRDGDALEIKGRVARNLKNMGHICRARGALSSCHRCESIACGSDLQSTCELQVQGVPWDELLPNIPAVSDTPWAIGGQHRNDFGSGSHACVMLSPDTCVKSSSADASLDYSACRARCWGYGVSASPEEVTFAPQHPDPMPARLETDAWILAESDLAKRPQGEAWLLAGASDAEAGHVDGPAADARFNEPTGIAIDKDRNVYVADSGNHVIRRIDGTTREVTTLAGIPGTPGSTDGAALSEATFDAPTSVALYYDWSVKTDPRTGSPISNGIGELTLLVSDANNHRIRKIVFTKDEALENLVVETLAGRKGEPPSPGFADGDAKEARFDTPAGIAVDDEGILFVADSHNHLVRRVMPNGDVTTVAGTLRARPAPPPSCRLPCLEGVPGQADGNTTHAKFFFPSDVAIGPEQTILVVDGNRLRRVTRIGLVSTIQGEVYQDSVHTVAGQLGAETSGRSDGSGTEASFNAPAGVTMDTLTGRVYMTDTMSCRVRRVTPASLVAQSLTCDTRLDDIVRPMGCASYEPPEDALMLMASDVMGNIHYNWETRNEGFKLEGWTQAERAFRGRTVHRCQGSPPRLDGSRSNGQTLGSRKDTDAEYFTNDEDRAQGTAIYVSCPSACESSSSAAVFGDPDEYTDDSSICRAAVHAGLGAGLIRVVLLPDRTADFSGSTANGVAAQARVGGWPRNFRLEAHPIKEVHVATVAGRPAAPLEDACGAPAALGSYELPMESQFRRPRGVAIAANVSLTKRGDLNWLYIADTGNHAIRAISATCAKVCENGGECIADDQCQCASGWEGDDCTTPICTGNPSNQRQICVAPDTYDCIPGYTNAPACDQALCVQTCHHGGECAAPDTCACASGWMDANCTTPVCDQTCGNGANCTAPNTCTCPSDWTGDDCRQPVCTQTCMNGGTCVAPDTCRCTPEYSGHDCSLPVCNQGFLVAEDPDSGVESPSLAQRIADAARRFTDPFDAEIRGLVWRQYVPCDLLHTETWCNSTNEFDCLQSARTVEDLSPPRNGYWRQVTGMVDGDDTMADTNGCFRIEVNYSAASTARARAPFPYETESANEDLTELWRFTPFTPYGWNAAFVPGPDDALASDFESRLYNWRAPGATDSDRMVAFVRWAAVGQGKYVCANGGSCVAPDTCRCAPGWQGFDCRTPICEQGYYEPPLTLSSHEVVVELENGTQVPAPFGYQGLYECSMRAFTEWENPLYMHDHPNFYSRYMDHHADEWSPENRYQLEPERPYYYDDMGWPATYYHTEPAGNYTNLGWTRKGYWTRISETAWQKGKCTVEYIRTCDAESSKVVQVADLRAGSALEDTQGPRVLDTFASYSPFIDYTSDKRVEAFGRWIKDGNECIDHVFRGCKNNGTCVAPATCSCDTVEGEDAIWEGDDCTVPVCSQKCSRSSSENLGLDNNEQPIFSKGIGNCTMPDTCTCERGWTGNECEVPLCAQECNNNGLCTAPDTCTCPRWQSLWRDDRHDGGRPLYQDDVGDPQLTGWTGYDCSTPICSQAEAFVPNDDLGTLRLGGYGLILYGDEPFNNVLFDDLTLPPYEPYTWSNDIPPVKVYRVEMRTYNEDLWDLPEEFLDESNRLCRMQKQRYCTNYPNQSPLRAEWSPGDGEVVRNDGRSYQSGCRADSGRFSDDMEDGGLVGFLCNVLEWEQGDYDSGRYIRQSNQASAYLFNSSAPLAVELSATPLWYRNQDAPVGEGVYQCYNMGSCVSPDVCSCSDGYSGYNCKTPLCRHRLPDDTVVSCLNGGTCTAKDSCTCDTWDSELPALYEDIKPGKTGYTGTACQIPICIQGTFDETCSEVSPGSEGCYRCENGGLCTAPDTCTCPEGWTGVDCSEPVCELRADVQTILDLQTTDPEKIKDFELDPCQNSKRFLYEGFLASQGNCSAPNTCTCFCKRRAYLDENGEWTEEPWHHPLGKDPPIGYIEGTLQCIEGYEGIKDYETGLFKSCHLIIYRPNWYEQYAITLIVFGCFILLCMFGTYIWIRRRIRQRYLLARAERRQGLEEDELSPKRRRKRRNGDKSVKKKKRRNSRKVM